METKTPYRLGIDMGTNSIGFALVELDTNDTPIDVIRMGVRIFSDGRESGSSIKTTKPSLCEARRKARASRRRQDRFVRRRNELFAFLVQNGLLPKTRDKQKSMKKKDPYKLRFRGISEKLSLFELGRAIFHLSKRRGYKSNRKIKSSDDDGKIKSGIQELKKKLEKDGKTVGSFLYNRKKEGDSVRIRYSVKEVEKEVKGKNKIVKEKEYHFYPKREMIIDEFDKLIQKQAQFYPDVFDEKLVTELKNIIFYQRDLLPQTRGKCSLIENEERAYTALPSSQYFRLLKELNNLKIVDKKTRVNRNLTDPERETIKNYLLKHNESKFSALAKQINLKENQSFNLESSVREKMQGLPTIIALSGKKCFGDLFPISLEEQDKIVLQLIKDNEEAIEKSLKENFPSLTEEQIEKIFRGVIKLEQGTMSFSSKAIKKLILELEKKDEETNLFQNEYQAIIACGWECSSYFNGKTVDFLPYYGKLLERRTQPVKSGSKNELEYGKIANPTVHVALNQLRKVVNDIVFHYGKPKEIAIEFARALKLSKKEKKDRKEAIEQNNKNNKKYDKRCKKADILPTPRTRLRQKLWEEQDKQCAYSGNPICLTQLLSEEIEIDHILPRSRTFDDTTANKVVSFRRLNQFKGNRTPYEAFVQDSHNEINWEELNNFVTNTIPKKHWRFEENAMERFEQERENGDKGWQARQLNDTSYMSRVAREYLRHLVGDKKPGFPAVDTYPGRLTAKLCRAWEFYQLLPQKEKLKKEWGEEKNREDHRHHAIDALVVACLNRSILKSVSTAVANNEKVNNSWMKSLLKSAPPYIDFKKQKLQEIVDSIIISHKPDHGTPGKNGGTSGQLHKDTNYGLVQKISDEKGLFVISKDPISFSRDGENKLLDVAIIKKNVAEIQSVKIREALQKRIDGFSNKESEKIIKKFFLNNRSIRILEEIPFKSLKAIKDKNGKPYRYVYSRGNHCIEIFCPILDRKADKKRGISKVVKENWYGEVITTFDINQKGFIPKWKKEHPTAKLIMRLHINDMVAYEDNGKTEIRRVQKVCLTRGNTFLKPNIDSTPSNGWSASANKLQETNARKISVSPAGFLKVPLKS